MTELTKIPVPRHRGKDDEKQASLIERAVGSFDLGNYAAPPVPEKLAEARPKRPVRRPAPNTVQTTAKPPADPEEIAEPEQSRPVEAETAPQITPEPNARPVEFRGTTHAVDRDRLLDRGMILPEGKVTALLEEFRIVKRQLLTQAADLRRRDPGGYAQRILVSSPHPGEGKTYCSVNLALAIAAEKESEVLLVDADFANPSVLEVLGLPDGPGLMDALADKQADVADFVMGTDIPGLWVLPAGGVSNSDSEFLSSSHTPHVLDRLTEGAPHRKVIFDSSPALSASPAAELANHVAQAVMIVRADKTGQGALEDAISLLSACPNVQLLLNAAQFSLSGRRFGDYGYRGVTIMPYIPSKLVPIALVAIWAVPSPVAAQSLAYGDVSGSDSGDVTSGDGGAGAGSGDETPPAPRSRRGSRGAQGNRIDFVPYIEVAQVATAQLSPGSEVLTYSQIAAGIDAAVIGQRNALSASLRYERRVAWNNKSSDGDTISGVASGYTTVMPGVQLHAGGLAARTRIEDGGASVLGPLGDGDAVSQVYSVYAGPSVTTMAGDVAISANYRFGYTRVESPDAVVTTPGSAGVDVFDDSTVHAANASAVLAPRAVLPVGIGVSGQVYREDISNLDQRVDDRRAMGTVTVPLGPSLAVTGSVGYEDVKISARDAVRDVNGDPVVGPDGRFVTDKSSPRITALDVSGLIWDVGVSWRPSRRTALEAHVGRRYGSTSIWGTFNYAPNSRSSLSIGVYDNVAGFGGQINNLLAELPEDFVAVRNPITGDLSGCVSSLEAGNCLSGALGSVRSSTFRARGIAANYSYKFGRFGTGIGAGYDRRKFIAAPGTVLASSNGLIDENYWLAAYLNGQIDRNSSFSTNLYANWLQTGDSLTGDISALGATAAYFRTLTSHLTATAALGIDSINRQDTLDDITNASALVGVRYSF